MEKPDPALDSNLLTAGPAQEVLPLAAEHLDVVLGLVGNDPPEVFGLMTIRPKQPVEKVVFSAADEMTSICSASFVIGTPPYSPLGGVTIR